MPHSWFYPTTLMQEKVARMAPMSVLDIGVGYGKWGFLLREQLDWNPAGRLKKEDWEARIVGVEVFAYESPLHDWADVLEIVDSLEGYDLIVMSDVIEHIEKQQALDLLRRLLRNNRNILISTPFAFFTQEVEENEHEDHVSHWTLADFAEFTFDYDVVAGAAVVVTLAGKGATWPTARDSSASRRVYTLPLLGKRSTLARMAKQALVRL